MAKLIRPCPDGGVEHPMPMSLLQVVRGTPMVVWMARVTLMKLLFACWAFVAPWVRPSSYNSCGSFLFLVEVWLIFKPREYK